MCWGGSRHRLFRSLVMIGASVTLSCGGITSYEESPARGSFSAGGSGGSLGNGGSGVSRWVPPRVPLLNGIALPIRPSAPGRRGATHYPLAAFATTSALGLPRTAPWSKTLFAVWARRATTTVDPHCSLRVFLRTSAHRM
jgi:hypothetical protein